nr:zinc finger MYM-type protein 4 isoform X2 [Misgurnus anguillicaudatus]
MESSEPEVKTSKGQAPSEDPNMDDELDGLPVFGADEDEWEMDSSFKQQVYSQLERNSDDEGGVGDKNESQDGVPTTGADADEQSNSNSGSSKMDEERTKASEENFEIPSPDTVIDIQETPSQAEIRTSPADTSLQKTPPAGQRTDKETHFSPVIQIKDEPIDEDYDKALLPQTDTSNVKQEVESEENEENEAASPSDELRISSVFSVRGNNSGAVSASVAPAQPSSFPVMTQATSLRGALVLPPQAQLQLRLQPNAQMQPQMHTQPRMQQPMMSQPRLQPPPQIHAPPPTVRICCSGCSKVLQKGQTAFQRKGSNQLFCSTVCLTSFSLPSVQFTPIIAPKKTCHLCLKVIVNLKDLITIPVGSMNTLKEFCSPVCLNIYKDRYEDAPPDQLTHCNVCKLVKEIQHEVTHLGVVHKLCSDECFARFRSSRNLYMSYCENCGNCTASGNYHLVQIEDGIKKFCSTECITTYKQKSDKRLRCPYCQEIKLVDQMIDGTNIHGVTEFFCSQRCVAMSQASPSLTGTSFPCTSCKKLAVPQYHLAIADGSIRNFCSLDCVAKFQDKMNTPEPHNQINGNSHEPQNVTPSQPPIEQPKSTQTSSSTVPGPSQNPVPPHVPGLVNPQDAMQQGPGKAPSAPYKMYLTCKQCDCQFYEKPEVFQYKGHSGIFCTRACCETYKRENNVKAVCEYCKLEKVVKDVITYEKQQRYFCCEGCKLLFKHDLTKRQGVQFRFCANCQNMTHKTVQNFFGGKLEEFCTEDCMSQYTVLFYEMAKCYGCKKQGSLKESLALYGQKKYFCNMNCLMLFCSKSVLNNKRPNSTVSNTTTTVQAPLSISKDMPVIGGVVSLASTLPGNTAVTGALPTSNASSKNIGEASTQTDAAVPGTPNRRMLKNKALMCRPITEEQGVQCQPEHPTPPTLAETVIDENGEKVRLVPFPVPIPMPVYIPVPMHLYTQYTPFPLGVPLPVPVPIVIPGSEGAAEPNDHKSSLPAQSSVEEDEDKGKDKPVSHDQGSTYSGDLESEARSTPLCWADNEEPGASGKQLVPSSEQEDPQAAPATSASPEHPDLEDDIPRSSTDPCLTKENRLVLTLKRRRKAKDGYPAKKRESEITAEESGTYSEDVEEEQTPTPVNSTYQILQQHLTVAPVLCHPNLKFTSPTKIQLKMLMKQSQGRPDRFGCLLFRSVLPERQCTEWASTTNWSGLRGKYALPLNLRHFIIKAVSQKFPGLTRADRKRVKDRINEFLRLPRSGAGPRVSRSNPKGRKRSGPDASGGVWLSTTSSKLNQAYGVAAWSCWVKKKSERTADEEDQQSCRMVMKQDVLQCSFAELNYGLCRFIKEARRPNGEVYKPDSIYYLCLGIQQCLLENGRLENIFTDSLYSEFISEITKLLRDWANTLPPGGYMNSRVEEEYLWECKQLGALSPIVLLNTLLFFVTKMLNLKTVEQHRRLTFANVTQCTKTTKTGTSSYLKFKLPIKEETTDKKGAGKRKKEEEVVDEEFVEMPENSENPLRCPVRLYQFYLSKCLISVRERPDLFYLQPESSCHPGSPVWYSAQPLDTSMMESMLTRIIVVRDVHMDTKQQKYPDSSDESSQ